MFVRAANPVWYFVDLIGLGLNDEYYAFFLTNTLPYLPQAVYRDPQGLTAWPNPLEFFPNGTFPNNLYFDPDLVYRIEIRHGNSQADPLIYEINNFVPNEETTISNNSLTVLDNENQISNSNFSQINFVSPLVITTAGTYLIAPGWELVLTGAGSTTITQLIFSGSENIITDPAYALEISNNGWTEAYIRQRFHNNGAIWANGAITMSLTASANTSAQTISLIYAPNAPGVPQEVATGLIGTGNYVVLSGAINLPASGNSSVSTSAYIDMTIQLPPTGSVNITNFQVIGQTDPIIDPATQMPYINIPSALIPSYQQESQERLIDHLFHYYKNQLVIKPKKSLLTGWNFPLNPFQYVTTTVTTNTAITSYICDQTILRQELASQIQSGENTIDQRLNLLIKAVTAATNTRFALIQYIDSTTILPYWSYVLAAFARARIFTSHGTAVHLKCRLIYQAGLPPAISNIEPIASWAPASDPAFALGWTAITPLNDPAYLLPNAYAIDEVSGETAYPYFSFDGFQMPNASNTSMTLGIVIYTMDNLNATSGTEDSIAFDKISLIPSYFGADAQSQTFDESLRDCQFYYEKSYDISDLPGTTTTNNTYFAEQLAGDSSPIHFYSRSFNINYKAVKRSQTQTITFYSPVTGSSAQVHGYILNGSSPSADADLAITNWNQFTSGEDASCFKPVNTTGLITLSQANNVAEAYLLTHYTIDARLGV